jgi:retron-type reverse transcriptase
MKTHSNIFEKAFSFENLLAAYMRARRGKQGRHEIATFGWRLEAKLLQLREELLSGSYAHGAYRHFIVSDSKRREIQAAPFRDRVVHHAVVAALEPIFEKGFIYDTYACRVGKGTQAALERFEQFSHVSSYVLSMDISKYFANIDHAILFSLLKRKIRDTRMLALCQCIIASTENSPGRGIPIGNLTSQLFANMYLNEFDQYAKHTLRLRRYIRYMDDVAILSDDKKELHEVKEAAAAFLHERLGLTLHPRKVQLMPTETGVDFLGYRIYPHYRQLRKSTVTRFIARMKREKLRGGGASKDSIRSWLVYAREANSHGLLRSLARRFSEPQLLEHLW